MANITGTAGNDILSGTADDDLVDGGGGDDTISGGAGTDTLRGGEGVDTISDSEGGGSIEGGAGADSINAAPHFAMVAPLVLDGGLDNDFIAFGSPQAGDVTILGGQGSDHVLLWEIADSVDISLGAARDQLTFGYGHFTQHGSSQVAMNAITVSDFAPGNSGDVLNWLTYLGSSLIGWDQTSNPFGARFARLLQSGTSTLLQIDLDGRAGTYGYQTLLTLENTSRTAFTSANFAGYNPSGKNPTGKTLNGTGLGDHIVGTLGADTIATGGGNDVVFAGAGSDIVDGGAANDILIGEVGHDVLRGADGDDYLDGNEGDDTIEGGNGIDHITGGEGDDMLLGGDGNDYLTDNFDDNHFDGGAGDDEIVTEVWSTQASTIIGGLGNDLVRLRAVGTVDVDLGVGDDVFEITDLLGGGSIGLVLGAGLDTLRFALPQSGFSSGIVVGDFVAGPWGDMIDWADSLTSGLIGWDGSNPFFTGHLRLRQVGSNTLVELDLDAGDFHHGFVNIATLENVLASDLTTENLGGYSLITVRNGTSRANTLQGRNGAERLNGFEGNDVLLGSGGNDLLVGDSGNDRLDGGTGADRSYGGTGNDVHLVDNVADRVFEQAGEGFDRVESSATFTLSDNVEDLLLVGAGATHGTGNALANRLVGNGAANRLAGGDGNDVIDGGAGADTMIGGRNSDIFFVDNPGDAVVEARSAGFDTVFSSVDFQLPIHVERLIFTGTTGITGLGNSDDNIVTGNSGNNVIGGRSGNDVLDGGAGSDRIYGEAGHDDLIGGAGGDRFQFNTALGPANVDDILDFNVAQDSLYLARSIFTGTGANGTLSAAAFHKGTAAADAGDRILYDQARGNIFYDADGTGAAAPILFATVTDGTALTNADFVIYG